MKTPKKSGWYWAKLSEEKMWKTDPEWQCVYVDFESGNKNPVHILDFDNSIPLDYIEEWGEEIIRGGNGL